MCIQVVPVDLSIELVSYDPDRVAILIRRGTYPHHAVAEIRAILSDLDAPPAIGVALSCFCGDPITLPPELVAVAGRHSDHRQVLRGA